MESFQYKIKDVDNLNASGVFLKVARMFKSEMHIKKGNKSADLARLMWFMNVGIKNGDIITVTADGIDEKKAICEMKKLLEEKN